MWRHIDVQADWRRSLTYGRAPNAIVVEDGRRNLIDFGSRGQRSRSTFALCIRPCGQNTDNSFCSITFKLKFTCQLWVMRWGTLLILDHGVKGQGQLCHSVYKALWAQYRLQFLPNHFQTSHVSCVWWEEEPYWFWVTGSKVNFGNLCIRPCGYNTDYSLCLINFKLHM